MFNFSLKTKIIGMVAGVAIVLFGTASISFWQSTEKEKHQIVDRFSDQVSTINDSISAQFFERYFDVQAFALNPTFLNNDRKLHEETFNKYVELYGIYDFLGFFDTKGNFISSNSVTSKGDKIDSQSFSKINFSEEEWFKKVSTNQLIENKEQGFTGSFVEDPRLDKYLELATGKKYFTNGFSTAVKNRKGETIGYMLAKANFVWVEKEFLNFHNKLKLMGFQETELTLVDNKGTVIVDYDPFAKGSAEMPHDFEKVLNKLNLAERGVTAVQALT